MLRAIDKWLLPWVRSRMARRAPSEGLRHLVFCVADHFEPFRQEGGTRPAPKDALKDVKRWCQMYQEELGEFEDADGEPPRHTFFYPAEDYDEACLQELAEFCEDGFGEVEIQLHHRNDTPADFKRKIATFKEQLRRLGFLGRDAEGKRRFGFVHGNWALCNSRPDGDWCGIDDELGLLRGLGCYADFTFPSAPSPTQPRLVNGIYRSKDTGKPRAADRGVLVQVAASASADAASDELMLITGPLGVRFEGLRPRLENSAMTGANLPTAARIKYWVESDITVEGRPEWVFVKVHMHGCNELDSGLMGKGLRDMHRCLADNYNDGREWALHYVSAREMYNIVRAAESGKSGNCAEWRDFEVKMG